MARSLPAAAGHWLAQLPRTLGPRLGSSQGRADAVAERAAPGRPFFTRHPLVAAAPAVPTCFPVDASCRPVAREVCVPRAADESPGRPWLGRGLESRLAGLGPQGQARDAGRSQA